MCNAVNELFADHSALIEKLKAQLEQYAKKER